MISPQLTVQCHPTKKAPLVITRGSATTDHQFAYFTPRDSNSVYSYEWNTEQWNELPSCPYLNCALVIIDGTLTTVGGGYTNKLFTLRQRQWVEEYPPMNTVRSSPAVVSTSGGDYIIVIGGRGGGGGWTGTVELFQVKTRRWYKLTNISQPLDFPSATICGNQLHVIGYDDDGYSCSIKNLPSRDEPITSQSIPHLISWTSLPRLPVTQATAATLYEQLVIIGGMQYGSSVNSIHQLVDGKWVKIGSMSSNRNNCLVVSPSPDRMMIVGGVRTGGLASAVLSLFSGDGVETVEECIVV